MSDKLNHSRTLRFQICETARHTQNPAGEQDVPSRIAPRGPRSGRIDCAVKEAGAQALQPGGGSPVSVALPLTSCVASGERLRLSVPQLLIWEMEATVAGRKTAVG